MRTGATELNVTWSSSYKLSLDRNVHYRGEESRP
jgi:hypothetical protein